MSKNFSESVNGVASVASTKCVNDQQWTRYHARQRRSYAAEDANAMHDILHGKSVDKVGGFICGPVTCDPFPTLDKETLIWVTVSPLVALAKLAKKYLKKEKDTE